MKILVVAEYKYDTWGNIITETGLSQLKTPTDMPDTGMTKVILSAGSLL